MELDRSSRRPLYIIYPRTNFCVLTREHIKVSSCVDTIRPRTSLRPYELYELHELT